MQSRTIFSLPIFGHDHVLDINCCRSYHLDFVLHLLCSVEKNVCLNACDTTSTTFECNKSCYISRCSAQTSRINLIVFRFMLYCVVELKYRNCLSVAILFLGLLLCFIFCDCFCLSCFCFGMNFRFESYVSVLVFFYFGSGCVFLFLMCGKFSFSFVGFLFLSVTEYN